MDTQDDLEIYSETPFRARLLLALDRVLLAVFRNPKAANVWDLGAVLFGVLIVSRQARIYIGNSLFSTVLMIILPIFTIGWVFVFLLLSPFVLSQIHGKPIFGKLGGDPRKAFFAYLKLADALNIELRPEDLEKVKLYNQLNKLVIEETLKLRYRENRYERLEKERKQPSSALVEETFDPDDPNFNASWSRLWNDTIMRVGTENLIYKDFLAEENVAARMVPIKLQVTTLLVSPFVKLFQLVMIFLMVIYLNNGTELITVIQVGAALSFVMSLILFINQSTQISEIPLMFSMDGMDEKLKQSFRDVVEKLNSLKLTIRPKRFSATKRYMSLVRDYFLTSTLAPAMIYNVLLVLLWVGLILLTGTLWSPTNKSNLISWYSHFSLGLVLLVPALAVAYWLTVFVLQHIKTILAPLIVSLLVAVLPFAIEYLFTGHIDLGHIRHIIVAAVLGASALLATNIASIVKKDLEK